MEILIVLILTALLIVREYTTYKERQKLLDRIMSKDYSEFKAMETPEENKYDEDEEKSDVEIEDAKEVINAEERE